MSISELYNYSTYNSGHPFIINNFIREYDLSKANINVLRWKNVIGDRLYNELYNADRMTRQITIGNMIKDDKSIIKILKDGILEARKLLFEYNYIQDSDILSIKNDAIFTINKKNNITKLNNYIDFKLKNTYVVYFKILNYEIYYYDKVDDNGVSIKIDIKGINDILIERHYNGIVKLFSDVCYFIQRESVDKILYYLSDIYDKYVNRVLPKEYYIEFSHESKYRINVNNSIFYLDSIDNSYIKYLDINRNLMIIRELINIISKIKNIKR